jgi:DNA end-binding protein Ku
MARQAANDRDASARRRPIWKGILSFGLVNVPVSLYAAVARRGVHFRQVHDEDGARIKLQRVCTHDGAVVPREHIALRIELERGHPVQLLPAELHALDPGASRTVEIDGFVDPAQIDPIFYDRTYHLAPDEGGARAYALLAAALEARRLAAIARLTLRGRPRVAVVRPLAHALTEGRSVLALTLLAFVEELLPASSLPGLPGPEEQPGHRELSAAERLVETQAEAFDPGRYHDEHREAVLALLARRTAGLPPPPEPTAPPAPSSDLLGALEASLEEAARHKKAA